MKPLFDIYIPFTVTDQHSNLSKSL